MIDAENLKEVREIIHEHFNYTMEYPDRIRMSRDFLSFLRLVKRFVEDEGDVQIISNLYENEMANRGM